MPVTFYHVRISVQGELHDEVKVDMEPETLERQILQPYRSGAPITINGKTVDIGAVQRIRVGASEEPSAQIVERLRAEDRGSSVVSVGGPDYKWRAAARALDVTDQFITGPPGPASATLQTPATPPSAEESSGSLGSSGSRGDAGAVFVVAGRDSAAISAIVQLLRCLGLRLVEWEHAVAKTGLPNPYVGDIVEAGLRMAGAAVVILTPDDVVQLRGDLLRDDDGPDDREIRGQARPNVYYEAGIADTLGRERTVIIEIGNVKSFSDAAGRHVVRYDGTPGKRHALAERLRLAGLDVDTQGNDWLTAGEVRGPIEAASAALAAGALRIERTVVNREDLEDQLQMLNGLYEGLQSKSRYDDFSDLPQESLQYVMQAQTFVDRVAAGTTYAAETDRVREREPHVRIPILRAVLESMRAETEA
jgi:hypothetical protein